MLKKVVKSFENPYGIEETFDVFKRPCIIGVFPELSQKKTLNGYLNKILYLMQIRHFKDIESEYDISTIPFDILINTNNDNNTYKKLIDMIPNDDIATAKKIVRNINIISYCYGHTDTARIINEIYNGILEKGYSKSDTQEIMKNIFVLQIVDNYVVNKKYTVFPHVSSIIIHDVDDFENINHQDLGVKLLHMIKYKNGNTLKVLYKSFGEGSLSKNKREHYFSRDYIYAPIINSVMSTILINALNSSINSIDIDINNLIHNIPSIIKRFTEYFKENKKSREDYTSDDLANLNTYMMSFIRKYCIDMLAIEPLDKDTREKLNTSDSIIKSYVKNNNLVHIESIRHNIVTIIESIIYYNDNYDKDKMIKINGNISTFMSAEDIIKGKFNMLVSKISEYIEAISSINIPVDIPQEMINNLNITIKAYLDDVRNVLSNEKFKEICSSYRVDEKTFKI